MRRDKMQPGEPGGLVRSLGTTGVLLLTLSVATPASSVFVIVPGMFQIAGTGALWALLIAGVVCVATAFIYAELSSAFPVVGGEYVMVAQTLGPMAGFVMLGINVFNNLIFLPVAGLGVSEVLGSVLPGLPARGTALAVVGGCTLVGILNIRINAWITGIFLALEVAALVAVSAFGLFGAERGAGAFLTEPVVAQAAALIPADWTAIGVAATIAIFALNGYGAAVYFGEEMHEAPRRIARAIMWALVATLLLEGIPIVAALMGAADLRAMLASGNPFGELVAQRGGPDAARWVSIIVALAIVNAIIAWVLACARFFYGTARDGTWGRPIDRWLLAIHPRFGSPWLGTLIIGAVGMALCFLPLRLLEVWSGTGLIAIYAGIAWAVVRGRRTGATAHAPYRMPWWPAAPIVTAIALVGITWTNLLDPVDGQPALIATGVQIVGFALYYRLVLRRRGWAVVIPKT
jgi:amino acid transporter